MKIKCDLKTKYVIYMYTNTLNNKKYIGKTTRVLRERHLQHIRSTLNEMQVDYDTVIHRAFRKYGFKNFSLEILFVYDGKDIDITNINKILSEQEIFFINHYNSFKSGYNMTHGGEGICGFIWTDELRQNKSKFMKEFWTQERKSKRSKEIRGKNNWNYGKRWSEEKRKESSKFFKEYFKNNPHPSLGRKHTDEAKKKMQEKARERFKDKESNPMYGKRHTEESRLKMSMNKKGKNTGSKNPKSICILLIIPKVNFQEKFESKRQAVKFLHTNYNISEALASKLSILEKEYIPSEHALKLNSNLDILEGLKFVRLND